MKYTQCSIHVHCICLFITPWQVCLQPRPQLIFICASHCIHVAKTSDGDEASLASTKGVVMLLPIMAGGSGTCELSLPVIVQVQRRLDTLFPSLVPRFNPLRCILAREGAWSLISRDLDSTQTDDQCTWAHQPWLPMYMWHTQPRPPAPPPLWHTRIVLNTKTQTHRLVLRVLGQFHMAPTIPMLVGRMASSCPGLHEVRILKVVLQCCLTPEFNKTLFRPVWYLNRTSSTALPSQPASDSCQTFNSSTGQIHVPNIMGVRFIQPMLIISCAYQVLGCAHVRLMTWLPLSLKYTGESEAWG